MPNTSQFSQYHPSWEGQNFSKDEYATLLKDITNKKPNEVLIADHQTIKTAGIVTKIWQTLKGWLGFENQTNPILVNYEILKLLRYGETHHFLDDEQIKILVGHLQALLNTEKQHSKVVEVIKRILPVADSQTAAIEVNREIKAYYHSNEETLHAAFWPTLFQKYIAPLHQDTATLRYNEGRIHSDQGNYAEAVHSIQEALQIHPERSDWQLSLVAAQLSFAERSVQEGKFNESLELGRDALITIQKLQDNSSALVYAPEYTQYEKQARFLCCALQVKQNNYNDALIFVEQWPLEDVAAEYEMLIRQKSNLRPDDRRLAEFYLMLAERCKSNEKRIDLTEQAITALLEATMADQSPRLYEQIIKAYLTLAQYSKGDNEQYKHALGEAWKTLRPHSQQLSSQVIKEFELAINEALTTLKLRNDIQGAKNLIYPLRELSQSDTKKCAAYGLVLADLHILANEHHLALQEIEAAYALDPTQDKAEKLITLAKEQAKTAREQARDLEAAAYLEKVYKIAPTDKENLRNLTSIHSWLAQWNDAEKWVKRLVTAHANDWEGYLLASEIAVKVDKTQEAIQHAKKAVSLAPNSPAALIQLFDLTGEINHSNIKEAIVTSLAIAEKRPNDPRIHIQLGGLYQADNELVKARRYLEKALRLKPDDKDILGSLGKLAMQERKYEEALNYYQHASTIAKSNVQYKEAILDCCLALADSARGVSLYPQMIKYYDQALALAPGKTMIIDKLFSAGNQLNDANHPLAIDIYRRVLPYLKTDTFDKKQQLNVYLTLATHATSTRDYAKALEYLEEGRKIDPLHPRVLKALANCYTAQGNTVAAGKALTELVNAGHGQLDSYVALAEMHQNQGQFESALLLYQKANEEVRASSSASSEANRYQPHINELLIKIAEQEQHNRPELALKRYKEALQNSSPEQKQKIATKLLAFGSLLVRSGQMPIAVEAFKEALTAAVNVNALPLQHVVEAYIQLAQDSKRKGEHTLAKSYYEKAVLLAPNTIDIVLELAEQDYAQGNFENAAAGYRKAVALQPSNTVYRQKLSNAELSIANLYYAKGIHDPDAARQSVLNLIEKVLTAPYAKQIETALGSWHGKNSSENTELRDLGKYATSPGKIEKEGRRACELIETAYDGQSRHMLLRDMPEDLREAIKSVRAKISDMRNYYETLQKQTDILAAAAGTSGLSQAFSSWQPLKKLVDLDQHKGIEEQAKKALQIFDRAAQRNPAAVTPSLQEQATTLRLLTSPKAWMHLSIAHYRNFTDLNPTHYSDHCNKLIDAYMQVGDYVNALSTFQKFKATFPTAPLHVDPEVYTHVANNAESSKRFTPEQIFNGILQAALGQERTGNFIEALKSYKHALQSAPPSEFNNVTNRILSFTETKLRTHNPELALEAYEMIIPHLSRSLLSQNQKAAIYNFAAKELSKSPEKLDKALVYYEQAALQEPNNPSHHEGISRVYSLKDDAEKSLKAIQRAQECDVSNIDLLKKLVQAEINVGNQYFLKATIEQAKQILVELVRYATVDGPYKTEISNGLGANLGWLSYANRELQSLGTSANTADSIHNNTMRAIQLIESVYDGANNHLRREDQPNEIKIKIDEMKMHLQFMQSYRAQIREQSAKLEDPTTDPKLLFKHAITHFQKAYQTRPQAFGEHCNRLIIAYSCLGDFSNATKYFAQFKKDFTHGEPLHQEPRVGILTANAFLKQKNIPEALKILEVYLEKFPEDTSLRKAKSHAHFLQARAFLEAKSTAEAMNSLKIAVSCGVQAEAAAYADLAQIYIDSIKSTISPESGRTNTFHEDATYTKEALANLKIAADIDTRNPKYAYELARFAYFTISTVSFDPLPYIRRAADLEPKNINCAYGLLMTTLKQHPDEIEEKDTAILRFKNLGGVVSGFEEYEWEDPAKKQ